MPRHEDPFIAAVMSSLEDLAADYGIAVADLSLKLRVDDFGKTKVDGVNYALARRRADEV